jgi:hypothetical protein
MANAIDLGNLLSARADRYARRMGRFILSGACVRLGSAQDVWTFVRACGGRQMRVVYRCLDGTVRDIVGRQGVYASAQDGTVRGIGHAMASADRLTLSFWTATHGTKVNTGTGAGYRTLRAAGILAIRVDGTDILTDAGILAIG